MEGPLLMKVGVAPAGRSLFHGHETNAPLWIPDPLCVRAFPNLMAAGVFECRSLPIRDPQILCILGEFVELVERL